MIPRGRLFWKYVFVLAVLVTVALLASGAVQLYFSYHENKAALIAIQKEKALGAASRIEAFVKEIERQMGWTTQPQLVAPAAALEQRKVDFIRLQRQVQAITELAHIDAAGREQLRVSRLAMDVVGSQIDFSGHPQFVEARKGQTWFGPVYFRKESEPYMTISMPQIGGSGVTVAEVNLKFIWDVISQIKIGKAGRAYVVDGEGNLIAHPDISLVLQKTSLAALPQVQVALATPGAGAHDATIAEDPQKRPVLSAFSSIPTLHWVVFAEQPLEEAFEPLYDSLKRTVSLLALGIVFSVVMGLVLARRMVRPIRVLQEGAAQIGAGALGHRIDVKTGDELEALAAQFNQMTAQLQESYATLEQRVVERTQQLTEALEQQTATSEVLAVISESPTNVEPVFAAILRNGLHLSGASYGAVFLFEDGVFRPALATEVRPELDEYLRTVGIRPGLDTPVARVGLERAPVTTADLLTDPRFSPPEAHRREGMRSVLSVPMLREGGLVGALTFHRREVRPFTDKQVELVKTFADQAVIAIENVRLFTALQQKNRALTAALEQQTATSEILRVISGSPTDIRPVFDAIVRNAVRLCDAILCVAYRFDGQLIHVVAQNNFTPEMVDILDREFPAGLDSPTITAQTIRERRTIHVEDLQSPDVPVGSRRLGVGIDYHTLLSVPMLREGVPVGSISVGRFERRPFSEEQIQLVQTFADQAVIAIENVRLFTELQEKNRAVTEALEQQTATGEILGVISSSPTDVQPVFDIIARRAVELCDALHSGVFRYDGTRVHLAGHYNWTPDALAELRRAYPAPPTRDTTLGVRAILDQTIVHIPDVLNDPAVPESSRRLAMARGYRGFLAVPMLREGRSIGAIAVAKREPERFSEKQVELLRTFADQAVIAIENVRLFTELQDRTRELARTVEQLQALSEVGQAVSSTLDLDTVLTTIVSRASQLAGADGCSIWEYDEGTETFRVRLARRSADALEEQQRMVAIHRGEGAVGRLAETRQPVQIPDILAEGAYRGPLREALTRSGYRALLAVPLLQEDRLVGGLVLSRKAPGEFAVETVELMKTFATQSALAIQNARLFQELEEKSRELEIANRHKSEFLANMSHELRTPLNAIIGFSEVLIERMFGELNDKQDEYLRDIYSSGRHLLSLINDILDLSKVEAGRMELDLGTFDLPQAIANALTLVRSRAEAHAIRLQATVDDRLGDFVADERKVKQILLNLLSNAVKFTPDGGQVTVTAMLVDGAAEIAVADTGIGIAPEDQAAVFEEFRQVGTDYARKREGTGLGLALTRKFVELHGGTIWLKSAPGEGAIFTFTLPVRSWPTSSS